MHILFWNNGLTTYIYVSSGHFYPAFLISALGKNSPPQFLNDSSCCYPAFSIIALWKRSEVISCREFFFFLNTFIIGKKFKHFEILFAFFNHFIWYLNNKKLKIKKKEDSEKLSLNSLPHPITRTKKSKEPYSLYLAPTGILSGILSLCLNLNLGLYQALLHTHTNTLDHSLSWKVLTRRKNRSYDQ